MEILYYYYHYSRHLPLSQGGIQVQASKGLLLSANLHSLCVDCNPLLDLILDQQGGGASPYHTGRHYRPHHDNPAQLFQEYTDESVLP